MIVQMSIMAFSFALGSLGDDAAVKGSDVAHFFQRTR
jgi:hypothetical protein